MTAWTSRHDGPGGGTLADGERPYLTDFRLALSSQFELSTAEIGFLREHTSHDRCYVVTHLVDWVVRKLSEQEDPTKDVERACAETGVDPDHRLG